MATHYLVHHPDGDSVFPPQRFERSEDARLRAFLLARITHRGVTVTRHPVPYKVAHICVSIR